MLAQFVMFGSGGVGEDVGSGVAGAGWEGLPDRARLGVLTDTIDVGLVDVVVELAGAGEQRKRKLTARLVVYFVLALALCAATDSKAPPGYVAVLDDLLRNLVPLARQPQELEPVLAGASALSQARTRLGEKPLALLFDAVRGGLADPGTPWCFAFGLRLVAWDGMVLTLQPEPALRAAFGTANGDGDPAVRMVTLVECGTHALIDAAFDGAGTTGKPEPVSKACGETALAMRLLASLRPGMLLLADRYFPGYDMWGAAAATGAALLWRVQAKNIYPPLVRLPDGSFLSVMPNRRDGQHYARLRRQGRPLPEKLEGHPIRVIDYTISITSHDSTGRSTSRTETFRLLTTLTDHQAYPAHALAGLYAQRWEAEQANGETKTRLKGARFPLRSKTPELVCQELWAMLCIHQALTRLRAQAATHAGVDPDRISFTATARHARTSLITQAAATPPRLTTALHTAKAALTSNKRLLPPRRHRSCTRERKQPDRAKYPTPRTGRKRPPSNVTHTLHTAKPP